MLAEERPTIWDVFERDTKVPGRTNRLTDLHDAIVNVTSLYTGGSIDLIPSRLFLAYSLKNPGRKEKSLAKVLSKIKDEYDLILIDCAPTESILTTAAYLSTDYLLVPVKPERLSSIGLPLLVNSLRDFRQEYRNHRIRIAGIVFNNTTNYTPEEHLSKTEVKRIAQKNRWHVFKGEIPFSRSFPKGAREGQPIFRTSYSRWHQVRRFNDFATEFAERIGL